jgi:DNA polymerase-3 subunit chi
VTDVAFHFNASDRLAYVCRLLRKAVGSGAKIVVTGSVPTLAQLDATLWTFSATDFVPHCFADSEARVLAASPVILASSMQNVPHRQVLVNLDEGVPLGYDRFERVIEVVGLEEQDRQTARHRWKHYAQQGDNIIRHDLALKTA